MGSPGPDCHWLIDEPSLSSKSSSSENELASDVDPSDSENNKYDVPRELPTFVNVHFRDCNGSLVSAKSILAWKHFTHSIGGSRNTIPTRKTKRKSKDELKANNFN